MILLLSVTVHTKSGRAAYFLLSAIVVLEKYQRCLSAVQGATGSGGRGCWRWSLDPSKCPNLLQELETQHVAQPIEGSSRDSEIGYRKLPICLSSPIF